MSTEPLLTDAALERLFAPLEQASGILAAVSGGPDSVAMMGLLAAWARPPGRPKLTIATVDHGLRAGSGKEAAGVAAAAARLDLPHRTIVWIGPKPSTGLQEGARRARYRLLTACAHEIGASDLVTAHTLDDQAETVLMRMARGSGLAGLAGMRPSTTRAGIRHVRPLLGCTKAELIDLCRTQGWSYIDDPSNADDRFARTRWRGLMPILAGEGLTPQRVARLAERAWRSEEALRTKAREVFARAGATGESSGIVRPSGLTLRASDIFSEPFEIVVRAVEIALEPHCRAGEFIRLARLEACTERLRAAFKAGESLRLTLAGAVLSLDSEGALRIVPEPTRRRGRYPRVRGDAAASPHSLGKGEGHA